MKSRTLRVYLILRCLFTLDEDFNEIHYLALRNKNEKVWFNQTIIRFCTFLFRGSGCKQQLISYNQRYFVHVPTNIIPNTHPPLLRTIKIQLTSLKIENRHTTRLFQTVRLKLHLGTRISVVKDCKRYTVLCFEYINGSKCD